MSDLLIELINGTLGKRPLNEKAFVGATEAAWQRCFDLALRQNVLAMTFPAMSSLPKELMPSFTQWSKWMAYTQGIVEQSQYKKQVVERMGSWLTGEGLTTTLLKCFLYRLFIPSQILGSLVILTSFRARTMMLFIPILPSMG